MSRILLIEDRPGGWTDLASAISPEHHLTRRTVEGKSSMGPLMEQNDFDIVLLPLSSDHSEDMAILRSIKTASPHTPIVVLSRVEETALIVKIIREGAMDFIPPPFTKEKMLLAIAKALEDKQLKDEINYLRRQQDIIYDFDRIIAQSPSMKRVITELKKFSQTDSTVLITGETGTGKSFLSGAVHFNSPRRHRPFIKINCANIPETLLESELFGHEKGAFTSANKTRVGRLEQGNGGTVFLDEIGEMTPSLQAKILRFLEEKSFERVGGNRTIFSDVRIIAATNRNPEDQMDKGTLREDLYYRINVLRIHLPPLRERRECIELLARFLLEKICRHLKKGIQDFSPEALRHLTTYLWPGNIRQLANTIERAVILEDSTLIQEQDLFLPTRSTREIPGGIDPSLSPDAMKSHERDIILKALEETLWIQKDAAQMLGISPRALNYKIRRLGITHSRWRRNQ